MTILIMILIGVAGGILSGLMGVGGGIILIPLMAFFLGLSQRVAQGTSLAILLLPIGILAVWKYWQTDSINFRIAAFVALGFVVGAYAGAAFAQHISDFWLKRIFAVFLILVGAKMLLGK